MVIIVSALMYLNSLKELLDHMDILNERLQIILWKASDKRTNLSKELSDEDLEKIKQMKQITEYFLKKYEYGTYRNK